MTSVMPHDEGHPKVAHETPTKRSVPSRAVDEVIAGMGWPSLSLPGMARPKYAGACLILDDDLLALADGGDPQ